jgi:hypothetical protein
MAQYCGLASEGRAEVHKIYIKKSYKYVGKKVQFSEML